MKISALIGLSLFLVGGLAAAVMTLRPYEYYRWTVNRKTSVVEVSEVKMWFFSRVVVDEHSSKFDLADYGELTAPDVTYIAKRNVSRWYPWSEYDDDASDETFFPGIALMEASEDLFNADRFVVSSVAREKLKALRKTRLQIWNSPRVEVEDPAFLAEIQRENHNIILSKGQ